MPSLPTHLLSFNLFLSVSVSVSISLCLPYVNSFLEVLHLTLFTSAFLADQLILSGFPNSKGKEPWREGSENTSRCTRCPGRGLEHFSLYALTVIVHQVFACWPAGGLSATGARCSLQVLCDLEQIPATSLNLYSSLLPKVDISVYLTELCEEQKYNLSAVNPLRSGAVSYPHLDP